MKIPESVRIGGVEYPIGYVSNLRHGNLMAYGHIDFENCEILLSDTDGTAHQKRCLILWHEIMHGILYHMGYAIDEEQEEELVDLFARGVYQVLQDNGGRFFDLKEVAPDEDWQLV